QSPPSIHRLRLAPQPPGNGNEPPRFRPNSAGVQPPAAMLYRCRVLQRPDSHPMTDAPHDSTAVRFDAVRLDRGGRTILSGIDLSVPRGSITAVLGPSELGRASCRVR